MPYKCTDWLSPKSEGVISWNNWGNMVTSGLNQTITLVSGHYRAALELKILLPPKASPVSPLKQQNPDPMLTWNQWDQVKHKCSVTLTEQNCSLWNSENTYQKWIKRIYSWKKIIPGMHHGSKGNIFPSVLPTKPFISTTKKYWVPKLQFYSFQNKFPQALHSYSAFQHLLPNKRQG